MPNYKDNFEIREYKYLIITLYIINVMFPENT